MRNWRAQTIRIRRAFWYRKVSTKRKTPHRTEPQGKPLSETSEPQSPQPRQPDPPKSEIDYRTDYEPPTTKSTPPLQQPFQADSTGATSERDVPPTLASSSPSMANGCGRLLQQDPTRLGKWMDPVSPSKTWPLERMLAAISSPSMAKGGGRVRQQDPARPVKRIDPVYLGKPRPLSRVSALLWKYGLRSVLRR